jgi:CubicO group peptidase (beta-lactamase class C family)
MLQVKYWLWGVLISMALLNPARSKTLPQAKPESAGMSATHLARLDTLLSAAVKTKQIPGAVIVVGRHGKIVVRKVFGNAQLIPTERALKIDAIFDLASVTKPTATATAVMLLIEDGKLRLLDKVNQFIPEFTTFLDSTGKTGEPAQIYHLLTHTSGLAPYTTAAALEKKFGKPCPDSLIRHIARLPKNAPVGAEFNYSCLGFITLGEIVKRISGKPLNEFVEQRIFKPLEMQHTGYLPPESWKNRLVPTEVIQGVPLLGTVHDPLAQLMGGISGNAGLFSTADDLAIFAQMLLQKGEYNGVQVLHPLTVERMTTVYEKVAHTGRGLGWGIYCDYSSNKGDLFPPGGFGHTGYTGTSIWIDPATDSFVILLTNRVHPHDKGSVVQLRSYVANVVAAAIIKP